MARYRRWLEEQRGLTFADYEQMRQWSVREIDAFWQSIWDYFDLQSPTPHSAVLAQPRMPGAIWFSGAQVNYARQVLRHVEAADAAGMPAIVSSGEDGVLKETSWPELRRKVGALAIHLKAQGVRSGDRVAAYLPNIPETIIAFLATAPAGSCGIARSTACSTAPRSASSMAARADRRTIRTGPRCGVSSPRQA
jgi:acetoacetyl-CoA synthetase